MSRDDSPTPSTPPPPSDGAPEAPELRKITDARTLRALAHPVRIALFEELALGGAMTATEVGERIGESATTCSFHLRQLAKYGFVEEAGGGTGRSRPWRLTSIGMSFAPGGDPEAQIASDAVVRMFRERQFARYDEWRTTKGSYPRQWQEAAINSQYLFYLTAEELEQLGHEVHDLLSRWSRLEDRLENPSRRPPASVPVETLVLAHPIALPKPEGEAGGA
jgi:DNA-binding transcriptional ArsR family regulator